MLEDPECIKQLGNVLKTNVRACSAVGHAFVNQVNNYIHVLTVHAYTHLHTYVHVYIHTHIHVHVHTCTRVN